MKKKLKWADDRRKKCVVERGKGEAGGTIGQVLQGSDLENLLGRDSGPGKRLGSHCQRKGRLS